MGLALSGLTNLHRLELGVASKNFGIKGFEAIMTGMKQLKTLKALQFRCGVNRVKVRGAELLAEVLSGLTELEQLDLSAVENDFGDEGVSILSKAINSLTALTYVSLNLGFNNIRSYGLVDIVKMFFKKNLQRLKLNLSNNPLDDKELKLTLPYLKAIGTRTPSFEFEVLETTMSQDMVIEL